LNLDDIAWRMKDKAWFGKAIALLNRRHTWSQTLWSYGLLHGDQVTLGEYLRHSPFADRCGLRLVSPVLTLEPVERYAYQHLEYAPLVNARAHQVGARPKILNAAFREQYLRFLKVLSYQPAPGAEDKLALTIYLALQDRIGEAIDWFTRTDRAVVRRSSNTITSRRASTFTGAMSRRRGRWPSPIRRRESTAGATGSPR